MDKIIIEIDGKKIETTDNKTILEIAKEHNIYIPTLCHDDRLPAYGSCLVCVVEVEGIKRFVPSCSTKIYNGMKINTKSDRVVLARKMAVELLLSNHFADCIAPCQLECPANVNVQGFIALIKEKKYNEAARLHKEKNPFPLVCGRVCPAFCEGVCRRQIIDESVSIRLLKRFFADEDIKFIFSFHDKPGNPTGKKVAIIGAGPAGLSAAYYLRRLGHECTIFEAYPEPGGMMKYGIPAYRLPRDILEKEISLILELGVDLKCNCRVGKDIGLDEIKREYDAILTAIGAHKGIFMGIPGEDGEGVWNGIEFLRDFEMNKNIKVGKSVAVIGGGNTAMDVARTALRLGVCKVNVLYRRTSKEMPAWEHEYKDALDEGIEFMFLTSPKRIIRDNKNKLKALECVKMKLGNPDESGRRKPVIIDNSEFLLDVDTVIIAIGQKPDSNFLAEFGININKKGIIVSSSNNFSTNIEGIFAAGDAITGPDTVVRAAATGREAANYIHAYLNNKKYTPVEYVNVKKTDFKVLAKKDYESIENIKREIPFYEDVKIRKNDFREIEHGFSETQAQKEADRCLSCGCQEVFECELRKVATHLKANPKRFLGEFKEHPIDDSHPFLIRNPNKCIKCARCIRTCLNIKGIGAIGFIYRGFNVEIGPPPKKDLLKVGCDSCGQCVDNCPTGALTMKLATEKSMPLDGEFYSTYCTSCSMLCPIDIKIRDDIILDINAGLVPYNKNICKFGSFSHILESYDYLDIIHINMVKEIIYNCDIFVVGSGISIEEAKIINDISNKFLGKNAFYIDENPHFKDSGCYIEDILNYNDIILIGNDKTFNDFYILLPWLNLLKIKGFNVKINGIKDEKILKFFDVVDFNNLTGKEALLIDKCVINNELSFLIKRHNFYILLSRYSDFSDSGLNVINEERLSDFKNIVFFGEFLNKNYIDNVKILFSANFGKDSNIKNNFNIPPGYKRGGSFLRFDKKVIKLTVNDNIRRFEFDMLLKELLK